LALNLLLEVTLPLFGATLRAGMCLRDARGPSPVFPHMITFRTSMLVSPKFISIEQEDGQTNAYKRYKCEKGMHLQLSSNYVNVSLSAF
jgi:hypothetical protein